MPSGARQVSTGEKASMQSRRDNKVSAVVALEDGWTSASRTRLLVLQVYFWTKNAADRQPEPDLGLLLLTPEGW